jgi:glucoamylase
MGKREMTFCQSTGMGASVTPKTRNPDAPSHSKRDHFPGRVGKVGFQARNIVAGVLAVVALSAFIGAADAADAPNPPGTGSAWTTGAKQGIGTSTTAQSKVWFTISQGITDEVYYPRVDLPNVQDLQFVVTDHATFVDVERDATNHEVVLPNARALTYQQINTAKSGRYRITKTYVTDIDRPTLLIETRFEVLSGGPYDVFVLYNPSLSGSGMGDTAATEGDALVASDGDVASALVSSMGFAVTTNGYSGQRNEQ